MPNSYRAQLLRVKLECLRLLTTLRLDPARQQLISGFVDTYLRLNPQEELQFERHRDTVLTAEEKGRVMELTTSWQEKGREQGRQEGRQEGRLALVLRHLTRVCGPLPESVATQVRGLSPQALEELAEALLEFESLDDLQAWLSAP